MMLLEGEDEGITGLVCDRDSDVIPTDIVFVRI